MNESQLILLALFAAAAAAAVFFWRQVASSKARTAEALEAADIARSETKKAKEEGQARRQEVEKLREQLQKAKTKLEKAKAAQEPKAPKRRRGPEPRLAEFEPVEVTSPSAAQVVHVSSREQEEMHRRALAELESKLAAEQARVRALEAEASRRKEEAERAAASLAQATAPQPQEDQPVSEESKLARAESLERELSALRKAAAEAQQARKKDIKRLELRLEAAHRRAANDHAAYQVIKGHLEIAEDRLAAFRRRYEGAKAPEEVRPRPPRSKKKRKGDRSKPETANGAQATPVDEDGVTDPRALAEEVTTTAAALAKVSEQDETPPEATGESHPQEAEDGLNEAHPETAPLTEDAHFEREDANVEREEDANVEREDANVEREDAHFEREDAHFDGENANIEREDAHFDGENADIKDADAVTEDAPIDRADAHFDGENADIKDADTVREDAPIDRADAHFESGDGPDDPQEGASSADTTSIEEDPADHAPPNETLADGEGVPSVLEDTAHEATTETLAEVAEELPVASASEAWRDPLDVDERAESEPEELDPKTGPS